MKSLFILITFQFIFTLTFFAQKIGVPVATSINNCDCSKVVTEIKLQNESNVGINNAYVLQFSFSGNRCGPVRLKDKIVLYRHPNLKDTLLLTSLTKFNETSNSVSYKIMANQLRQQMIIGSNYWVSYSMEYGITTVCPAVSGKYATLSNLPIAQVQTFSPGSFTATNAEKWVEIYTEANKGGTKSSYYSDASNVTISVTNPFVITVVVKPGYMAYVTTCGEFGDEVRVIGTQNIRLQGNCPISIRILKITSFSIGLAGISSQVHVQDCKRVFGTIKIRVYEQEAGVQKNAKPVNNAMKIVGDTCYIFNNQNADTHPDINGQYVFNDLEGQAAGKFTLPENFTLSNVLNTGTTNSPHQINYTVSEQAMREGRVYIEVIAMLGTAHKRSDVTPYFSDLRMNEKIVSNAAISTFSLLPNSTTNHKMVFGPYFIREGFQRYVTSLQGFNEFPHFLRVHLVGTW